MRAILEMIIISRRIAIPDNAAFVSIEEEIMCLLEHRINSRELATLKMKMPTGIQHHFEVELMSHNWRLTIKLTQESHNFKTKAYLIS